MGAGRTELAMSLFGHSYGHLAHGTLLLGGREVKLKNEKDAIRHGLASVSYTHLDVYKRQAALRPMKATA